MNANKREWESAFSDSRSFAVEVLRLVSDPWSKAPASRAHSKRFATQHAGGERTRASVWSAARLLPLFGCWRSRGFDQSLLTSAATIFWGCAHCSTIQPFNDSTIHLI